MGRFPSYLSDPSRSTNQRRISSVQGGRYLKLPALPMHPISPEHHKVESPVLYLCLELCNSFHFYLGLDSGQPQGLTCTRVRIGPRGAFPKNVYHPNSLDCYPLGVGCEGTCGMSLNSKQGREVICAAE